VGASVAKRAFGISMARLLDCVDWIRCRREARQEQGGCTYSRNLAHVCLCLSGLSVKSQISVIHS
jgi:hypothetical protein